MKIKFEKPDGRYCNMKNSECKKNGIVYKDTYGYICARCGGRVSKWLPMSMLIKKICV